MLYRVGVAFVLVAVGMASFYGAHYTRQALADDPPPFDANEIARIAAADQAKPEMNRVFNGIAMAPHGERQRTEAAFAEGRSAEVSPSPDSTVRRFSGQSPCSETNPPVRVASPASVSVLGFPTPSGWGLLHEYAISCGSTVVTLYREFGRIGDPDATLEVSRWLRATGVEMRAAAERVSAVTVGNKKALHVEPVRTSSGYAIDADQVIVTEPWGLTLVAVWESDTSPSARQVAAVISGGGTQ